MTRLAFAVLLLLHGLVHAIGFVVPWRLATFPEFAYSTTVLWGAVDVGDAGARAVGVLMLGCALALPIAAAGIAWRRAWAARAAIVGTVASIAGCALQSPAAILGLALSVAILAVLVWATSDRNDRDPGRYPVTSR